jgi:hypothetical protein
MVLRFGEVEVIELQFVAAEKHSRRLLMRKAKSHEKQQDRREQHLVEDGSSIAVDWKAQNRTVVDFETYEALRQERKMIEHPKDDADGRSLMMMRRLTRAVRKRM